VCSSDLVIFSVSSANAQLMPGLGLSADKEMYVDNIEVEFNTDFTVYAMAMNLDSGGDTNQLISSMPWVIHQVCCGAVVELMAVELNPLLNHTGHPLSGMVSESETCLDQEMIWLATLTVRMVQPTTETILWAGGPFGMINDCDGEVPLFTGLAISISMFNDEPTPIEDSSWGQIKAIYR